MSEILLPTDLSSESRKAIFDAIPLARVWNAHLTLLHVYNTPHNLDHMRGPGLCAAIKRRRQHAENALQRLGQQVREQYPNCSTEFREGPVDQQIAEAGEDLQADLMVIGTHPGGWFRRIAYGSDAKAILRLSPCPVLVVREEKPVGPPFEGARSPGLGLAVCTANHRPTNQCNQVGG
jgi:nucleotide-binding universal stress UspA family protein